MTTTPKNAKTAALEALIEAHAIELKLPTVRRRFRALAAEATREQQTPVAYLGALLEAEMAERAERRERRRLIDARFPQIKRLQDFRFADNPQRPAGHDRRARRGLLDRRPRERHLHRRLAAPARRCSRPRSRSAPATKAAASASPRSPALANELQEAQSRRELARVVGRYARTELVVLDELGYLALPDGAAELVFQVLSERHERGSLIVTTNLPFGEWTKVFPDPRLAKAVVDRLTHRAHIIDTGTESWRFRHGLTRKTKTPPDPRPMTAPARPSPLRFALRAQLRDDGRAAPTPRIRQHHNGRSTDAKWGHFRPSRWGHCKPSLDTAQLCPLLCPPAPVLGSVEPKRRGIIIRVSGVRVPPPALEVPANRCFPPASGQRNHSACRPVRIAGLAACVVPRTPP